MSETENPYSHSKRHGKCVASCEGCIREESRNHGIAEGLRMAADIVSKFEGFRNYEIVAILNMKADAKAKEFEEAKGEH